MDIRENLKLGSQVKQKEIIGYVGSTGLATGPHLDYRLQQNGVFKNPFAMKFKPKFTLQGEELARFQKATADLSGLLDSFPDQNILHVKNITLTSENNISFL